MENINKTYVEILEMKTIMSKMKNIPNEMNRKLGHNRR